MREISGDTTAGMLERLDAAVPDGTELVILAIFPYNDAGKGISPAEHEANIQKILSLSPGQGHQDDFRNTVRRRPADAIGWNSPDRRSPRNSRGAFAAASHRCHRASLTVLPPEFAASTVISGHRIFQRRIFAS